MYDGPWSLDGEEVSLDHSLSLTLRNSFLRFHSHGFNNIVTPARKTLYLTPDVLGRRTTKAHFVKATNRQDLANCSKLRESKQPKGCISLQLIHAYLATPQKFSVYWRNLTRRFFGKISS